MPDFWNDNISASSHLKKISLLEKEIKLWNDLELGKGDVEVLIEFAELGDTSLDEVNNELEKFINTIEDIELKMILGGSDDSQDAMIKFILAPVALKVKIGQKCFIECILDGLKEKGLIKKF